MVRIQTEFEQCRQDVLKMQESCEEKEQIIRRQNKTIFEFSDIRRQCDEQKKMLLKLRAEEKDRALFYSRETEKLRVQKEDLEQSVLQYQAKNGELEQKMQKLTETLHSQTEKMEAERENAERQRLEKEALEETIKYQKFPAEAEEAGKAAGQEKTDSEEMSREPESRMPDSAASEHKKKKIKIRVRLPQPEEPDFDEKTDNDSTQEEMEHILRQAAETEAAAGEEPAESLAGDKTNAENAGKEEKEVQEIQPHSQLSSRFQRSRKRKKK